jgi:molecular chaperone DnaK (HSP70)
VNINVFQGESRDLNHNRKIGSFTLEGLNKVANADGEILIRFELTLDGVLSVEGVERQSKIATKIKIDNALSRMGAAHSDATGARLETLFDASDEFLAGWAAAAAVDNLDQVDNGNAIDDSTDAASGDDSADGAIMRVDAAGAPSSKIRQLLDKADELRSRLAGEDADDVDRLVKAIEEAQSAKASDKLEELRDELDDLLFYLAE